jgi:hypothetical protein
MPYLCTCLGTLGMSEIKAFVAHSFSAGEKELIRAFVDHLDTLAGMPPSHSTLIVEKVEYSGRISGNAIFGSLKRSTTPSSLLAAGDNDRKVVMVLSHDQKEIHVMESSDSLNPQFYTLAQIP